MIAHYFGFAKSRGKKKEHKDKQHFSSGQRFCKEQAIKHVGRVTEIYLK